jgi:hypothetical protein
LKIVRFTNNEIFYNFESVCEEIERILNNDTYPPYPPYQRGAEEQQPISHFQYTSKQKGAENNPLAGGVQCTQII